MRKYKTVPTKQEVEAQLNELLAKVKGIHTIEQLRQFDKDTKDVIVEANYDGIDFFDDEHDVLDVIRYEYKNILVYFNINNDMAVLDEHITVYSDDDIQFDAVKLEDYDKEVERVRKLVDIESMLLDLMD